MFAPDSRYYDLPILVFTGPDGREIPYVSRRFAPQGVVMPLLMEVTTTQDDRLDLIATRTLGDPEQSWRICDANDAMNPADLTVPPGRQLRVPVPYPQQTGMGQPLASPLQNIVGGMNLLPAS